MCSKWESTERQEKIEWDMHSISQRVILIFENVFSVIRPSVFANWCSRKLDSAPTEPGRLGSYLSWWFNFTGIAPSFLQKDTAQLHIWQEALKKIYTSKDKELAITIFPQVDGGVRGGQSLELGRSLSKVYLSWGKCEHHFRYFHFLLLLT